MGSREDNPLQQAPHGMSGWADLATQTGSPAFFDILAERMAAYTAADLVYVAVRTAAAHEGYDLAAQWRADAASPVPDPAEVAAFVAARTADSEPAWASDAATDRYPDAPWLARAGVDSLWCIPFRLSDRMGGGLLCLNPDPAAIVAFGPDLPDVLSALGGIAVERRWADERARKLTRALELQAKELTCMHRLTEAIRTCRTLEELCRSAASFITEAWSEPELARVRIELDGRTYVKEAFEATRWGQASAVMAQGEVRGAVQVYYLAPVHVEDGGAFLPEERRVLDSIARALGEAVERHEAEARSRTHAASLDRERNRLEAVLRSIGEGVVVTDSDDRILLMNRAAQTLLDTAGPEPVGSDFLSLIPDPDFADLWRKTARQGRDLSRQDLRLPGPPPRALWVTRSTVPDLAEGLPGRVAILHDVTKEREIDQMKTDFVSAVSHELRTPLTSIKGFASTLRQNSDLPDSLRDRFLHIVNEEADRLASLIEELLVMARIESGRVVLGHQPVDLTVLVDSVLASVQGEADRKSLNIRRELDHGTIRPLGDPGKIRVILVNLMENAVKFTPEGGQIAVRTASSAHEVRIEVADSGIGIPEGEQHRIFERFYRVARPGRQEAGTGLGLFIAREMVRLHGGHIDVRSAPGQGATFVVYLPLKGGDRREEGNA